MNLFGIINVNHNIIIEDWNRETMSQHIKQITTSFSRGQCELTTFSLTCRVEKMSSDVAY